VKILIDIPIHESGLAALKKLGGFDVELIESGEAEPPARALDPKLIADVDVLICQNPPTNLNAMKALRWLQIASTGYDQLLGLGLAERGIRATNSRGCCDLQVAEWNLGMMINLVRDIRRLISNQNAAVWDRAAAAQGEIRGRTVGFWGYGGYARETARLARQLDMQVVAYTRSGARPRTDTYVVPGTGDPQGILPHRVFSAGEQSEFLGGLDFLILSLPLTPLTEGLIGERELRALPRTAFLLNPARGRIVQEAALLRALEENWIAGAALDAHFHYPLPPEHALWRLRNVIVTPHLAAGGRTPRFLERFWDMLAQNVGRFCRGEALLNELTPAELAGK
jgi:phosphoglycerate dehydrogenase-like enzyme